MGLNARLTVRRSRGVAVCVDYRMWDKSFDAPLGELEAGARRGGRSATWIYMVFQRRNSETNPGGERLRASRQIDRDKRHICIRRCFKRKRCRAGRRPEGQSLF